MVDEVFKCNNFDNWRVNKDNTINSEGAKTALGYVNERLEKERMKSARCVIFQTTLSRRQMGFSSNTRPMKVSWI